MIRHSPMTPHPRYIPAFFVPCHPNNNICTLCHSFYVDFHIDVIILIFLYSQFRKMFSLSRQLYAIKSYDCMSIKEKDETLEKFPEIEELLYLLKLPISAMKDVKIRDRTMVQWMCLLFHDGVVSVSTTPRDHPFPQYKTCPVQLPYQIPLPLDTSASSTCVSRMSSINISKVMILFHHRATNTATRLCFETWKQLDSVAIVALQEYGRTLFSTTQKGHMFVLQDGDRQYSLMPSEQVAQMEIDICLLFVQRDTSFAYALVPIIFHY